MTDSLNSSLGPASMVGDAKIRPLWPVESCQPSRRRSTGRRTAGARAQLVRQRSTRQVWLTVDRRGCIPHVDFARIRLVRVSGAALTSGIDGHTIERVAVRITNPARTVVDSFKFRNKIGIDVAVEAAPRVPPASQGDRR